MITLKPNLTIVVIEDEDSPQIQYRRCLRDIGIKDHQMACYRTRVEAVGFLEPIACLIADIQVYSGSPSDPSPADKQHGLEALRSLVPSRLNPGQVLVVSRFIENREVQRVVQELGIPVSNVFRGPVADEDLQEAVEAVLRRFGCCL